MINIPMESFGSLNKQTIMTINKKNTQGSKTSRDINSLNNAKSTYSVRTSANNSVSSSRPRNTIVNIEALNGTISQKSIPPLIKQIQKGQKIPIAHQGLLTNIQARLGWNIRNANCDVDVSAFLLNSTGKVLGDDWFVFYGQKVSPDGSTQFSNDSTQDKEIISIDFTKLNLSVNKIVFVLTINEALEKKLNFSMLKDAYIRIMDNSNTEIVSFKIEEYYSNITSMMIGEIYLHNGNWKFNAIGNGVAKDLAGLCKLYGVQVV